MHHPLMQREHRNLRKSGAAEQHDSCQESIGESRELPSSLFVPCSQGASYYALPFIIRDDDRLVRTQQINLTSLDQN